MAELQNRRVAELRNCSFPPAMIMTSVHSAVWLSAVAMMLTQAFCAVFVPKRWNGTKKLISLWNKPENCCTVAEKQKSFGKIQPPDPEDTKRCVSCFLVQYSIFPREDGLLGTLPAFCVVSMPKRWNGTNTNLSVEKSKNAVLYNKQKNCCNLQPPGPEVRKDWFFCTVQHVLFFSTERLDFLVPFQHFVL